MISWSKRIAAIALCVLTYFFVNAQSVYYYKLTKAKINGVVSTNVSGGQFICIYDGVCFDSDIRGNGVGNGQLNKHTDSKIVVYYGDSYFGKSSYYKFDNTFNKLNIITSKGDIYAYVKTSPPKGVTTSSLIKKAHNRNGSTDYYDNNNILSNSYPSSSTYNYETSNPNNSHNGTSHNNSQKRKCVYCNGTGQITNNDSAPSNFGIDKPREQCPTCGEWYNPNVFNHYHIRCRHCGGTGYAK